jgi:hypothetical protein
LQRLRKFLASGSEDSADKPPMVGPTSLVHVALPLACQPLLMPETTQKAQVRACLGLNGMDELVGAC